MYGDKWIFQPRRTDDLRPEMLPFVGQVVTEVTRQSSEGTAYEGIVDYIITTHETLYWIPFCDLEVMKK